MNNTPPEDERVERHPDQPSESLMSPSEIEAWANIAVDRMMIWLESLGIKLNKKPTVQYVDEECSGMIASVQDREGMNGEGLEAQKLIDGLRDLYIKHGVTVSDEALKEKVKNPGPISQGSADIILWKAMQRNMKSLGGTIAHEMWHLVEQQYGVMNVGSHITEGTAVYISMRALGAPAGVHYPMPIPLESEKIIYQIAMNLVSDEIGESENPTQMILNKDVRRRIQKKMEPYIPILNLKWRQNGEANKWGIPHDPAFKDFREKPNADNLIFALQFYGHHLLANELASQNIDKLVAYYAQFIQ